MEMGCDAVLVNSAIARRIIRLWRGFCERFVPAVRPGLAGDVRC